jgi:hypothetical protein
MKGIIMQREERKSIVLFNNGKIAEIPTRPNCEEGTVITVSYNRRLITVVGLFSFAVLLCAIFALRSVYYNPYGYIQINYGNAAVELAYNRFQRIVAVRPLNQLAVEPIAQLSLNNAGVDTAYEKILLSFTRSAAFARSAAFPVQNLVLVRIAQDNLAGAKSIEQSLSLFSTPLASASQKELAITFELYTHELYREAMKASSPSPAILPAQPPNSVPQMHRSRMGMGRRNWWCW